MEMKSLLNKTVKIACVTCVAVGAAALVSGGIALNAVAGGGKHLTESVKRILGEKKLSPGASEADFSAEQV